jgi:hypothetical protein
VKLELIKVLFKALRTAGIETMPVTAARLSAIRLMQRNAAKFVSS